MVIDPGNNLNAANNASAGKTRQANAQPTEGSAKKSASTQTSDSVSLSTTGQNMAKLEAAVAQTPAVDEAKVAQVKAAITSGQYKVDADSIADKMLAQDQSF